MKTTKVSMFGLSQRLWVSKRISASVIFLVTLVSGVLTSDCAQSALRRTQAESSDPIGSDGTKASTAETKTGDDSESETNAQRAWEFRPYRIAVWLVLDGSPQLNSLAGDLKEDLDRRSMLIDSCGWNFVFSTAPSQFRMTLLDHLKDTTKCAEVLQSPLLESCDKLMVVCLEQEQSITQVSVRELDLTTQNWGPLQKQSVHCFHQMGTVSMSLIKQAFMPITRIERVDLKGADTSIFLQVRAAESCFKRTLNSDQEWVVDVNSESPVFVKMNDRFLPIIRHTDRNGKLMKLQPIDFTFLSIKEKSETGELICSFVSTDRAPLAGRKTKTAERFALVVRPPNEPTMLYVFAGDKAKTPIHGMKVYSNSLKKESGEDRREPELLGKTDWEGKIEIPPSPEGIRVLAVGRGSRAIRLPMIPGLFPELSKKMPNDETSLYAEGVIRGYEKEILNLVIQRQVLEDEIGKLLDARKLANAKEKFEVYNALEKPKDIEGRLQMEKAQMLNANIDKKQATIISQKFEELLGILQKRTGTTRESEIQGKIQVQSNVPGAVEIPTKTDDAD